ncbi:STE24 endopeptidase [Catalinimonas alkaloidigena]|uniref:M48 family metallopeptidase n=1 Tax=Catalinimonas alkaloidigena TaxID=1075417 RepID=UPI002404DFBD|nr:M48 family metallopeptidase [Catalinimonas alkaloidigena]MDF9800053.1 STE24 endopeptidase [Catalinimonas alkaloidigena]
MQASTLLILIIAIVVLNFVLEQVLDALNRKNKKHTLPEELKGIYDEEKYRRSLAYQRANDRFHTLTTSFSFILSVILLATGFFGWVDIQLQPYIADPLWRALAYFGILFLASDIINLPFQLYGTFVIEEKFGFNKMNLKTFWQDKLKGYLLTIILGGLLAGVFLYLVMNIGRDFWWYFWVIAAGIMALLNMFYTSIFVPMFNKLKPLEEGDLREAIEAYGRKVDFPIKNVYVIDGSKRSSKSNAFFSGMGKQKKVVLYDTLIENHSVKELVAVIAHEVGHYKRKHILSGMLLSVLQIGFTLFVLSLLIFNEQLSYALGGNELAIHLNLIAFGILFSPISTITGLLMNIWSRKNEYEADAYATNTFEGSALATALKKLSVHNMSNLLPHPWYVFFYYSHPPLLARLKAITRLSVVKS